MRIAMAVMYHDHCYDYDFADNQDVYIASNLKGRPGIRIPGLKGLFRVNYHEQSLWISSEQSSTPQKWQIDEFFADSVSGLVIFCTEESSPQDKIPLAQGCEINFGRCWGRGKNKQNQLVIDLPFISREHGVIKKVGRKTIIKCTKGQNHIYVNEKKIQYAELRDGDKISICTMQMRYKNDSLTFKNTDDKVKFYQDGAMPNEEEATESLTDIIKNDNNK